MFIRAEIEFALHEDVTIIPAVALVGRNGQQGTFLVDLDALTVRFIPVTVGVVNSNEAEIIEPQHSGNVVTMGHHLLEDGSAITLPGRSEPGDDQ